MSARCVVALALVILWLWPSILHAQSEALVDAYNRGLALYNAGRYEEALPHLSKAVELGEREFGTEHETTAIFLNNLAELYRARGRYEAAEPLYKRALAVRERRLSAPTIRRQRSCSTTSPSCITCRAVTRRQSRSTSERW